MTESNVYKCDICGKAFSTLDYTNAKSDCHYHEEKCILNKVKDLLNKYKPNMELYLVTWENGICKHSSIFLSKDDAKKFYAEKSKEKGIICDLDSRYLQIN